MDKQLQTLYLQLHAHTKTFAQNAAIQVVVKILFEHGGPMKKNDIIGEYKRIMKCSSILDSDTDIIFDQLQKLQGISYHNSYYNLTTPKRKELTEAKQSAEYRDKKIIDKYFNQLYSTKESLLDWLTDVSIKFFDCYTDEWIADLVPNNKIQSIATNKESIRTFIKNRTCKNKELDPRDYEELVTRFYNFLSTKDSIVTNFLWNFGTTSFAARLLVAQNGIDRISLDAFKGSTAILDTNILLFISLDASPRHEAALTLVRLFNALGIEVKIFNITKDEYKGKVIYNKGITLKNIEYFPYGTAMTIPNDDFTKSALRNHCTQKEDVERFFDGLIEIPKFGDNSIGMLDDRDIDNAIRVAQQNERISNELNSTYQTLTGHAKKDAALLHDTGLLGGADYLRCNGRKCFILSEELSVNKYSNSKPLVENLPLTIRLTTLVNMFANTSIIQETNVCEEIFASLIRNNLQPVDAFRQEDLTSIYLLNSDIARLPHEQAEKIVLKIHRMKLEGVEEKQIATTLATDITQGRFHVVDDLAEANRTIDSLKEQQNSTQSQLKGVNAGLRRMVEKEFWHKTIWLWIRTIITPIIVLFSVWGLLLVIERNTEWFIRISQDGGTSYFWFNLIINILCTIITAFFVSYKKGIRELCYRKSHKEEIIQDNIKKQYSVK